MFRFEMRYKVRYKLPLLQLHFKGCNGNIQVLKFTHEGAPVIKSLQRKKDYRSLSLSDSLLYDKTGELSILFFYNLHTYFHCFFVGRQQFVVTFGQRFFQCQHHILCLDHRVGFE